MGKLAAFIPVLTLLCAYWQSAVGNRGYSYAGNVNNLLNKQRLKRTLLTLQIQNFYIVFVTIGF